MNAFPSELIQHHYACMLVAGLLPEANRAGAAPPSSTATAASEGDATAEGSRIGAASTSSSGIGASRQISPAASFPQLTQDLCDIFASRGRNTAWDPAKAKSSVFHSVLVDHSVRLPPRKTRPTPRTLAATLQGQSTTTNGSLASLAAALPPQSPLSPLHPSSPLFPDGLIAPIWLRKHRYLVPSVFVAFHCLAEHGTAPPPTPPKDSSAATSTAEPEKGQDGDGAARESDEAIVKAIASRKRSLNERGIKFTVVLLTTRAMLESPALEQRLSFIRRSSQLDSKASLFVLTPVSKAELSEFVSSLQSALYDSAMDYYREHYRRVRRKRTRYPPPASLVTQIFAVAAELRGSPIKDRSLSKEGWLARNEYKLGTFAELTGALDEAFTHYTAAYQTISSQLLTSTFLLPPRTKRWAEAKVLADTLNFRISKLLLYRNDGEGAWDHFRGHIKRFTELSQGWGIGEMTFEFWSWLGKQYRLMGDLLELATREVPGSPMPPFKRLQHFPPMPTILLHPSHLPTPTASGALASLNNSQYGNMAAPNEAAMASHVSPASMCPSPGECFYIAGICALERWERFRRLLWEEEQASVSETRDDTGSMQSTEQNWSTTSLAHEKKIDHAGQAIEVFSRAHEVLKRVHNHRLALFVASKIIDAYIESEQIELALRFLERTASSYEQERWPAPLTSQLLRALYCAQQAQDVESEGRALWRLMAPGLDLSAQQREEAVTALKTWTSLRSIKEEKRPLLLEYGCGNGPIDVTVVYSSSRAHLDGLVHPFQLRLAIRGDSALDTVAFDRLVLRFQDNEDMPPLVFSHDESMQSTTSSIGTIDLRQLASGSPLSVTALRLRLSKDSLTLIEGSIVPRQIGRLRLQSVSFEKDGQTAFSLNQAVSAGDGINTNGSEPALWCTNTNPARFITLPRRTGACDVLDVRRRECKVRIDVLHADVAYVDENFRLDLTIWNDDSITIDGLLDVHMLGPPGEVISTDEVWSVEQAEAGRVSSLRDIRLGQLAPASSAAHSVFIRCRGHLSPRSIEVVVRTSIVEETEQDEVARSETVKTIALPVKMVFSAAYSAQWKLRRDNRAAIESKDQVQINGNADGNADEDDKKDPNLVVASISPDEMPFISSLASLDVSLGIRAEDAIQLLSVAFVLDESSRHLRLCGSEKGESQSRQDVSVGGDWSNGDRWGEVFDVEVRSEAAAVMSVETEDGDLRPTGSLIARWRRHRQASSGEVAGAEAENVAVLPLPLLLPPHLLARLIATVPSSMSFEQPLVMLVTIVNPSRIAVDILIAIDDSQSDFGNTSHRTFTVPNLLPRSTRNVPIQLLPRSHVQTGVASIRTLPRVRAWQRDRRQSTIAMADTGNSRRTSIESAVGKANSVSMMLSNSGVAGRQVDAMATTSIVNHRSGAGVPLDVSLRYLFKANAGPTANTSAAGDEGEQSQSKAGNDNVHAAELNAHLLAETQRTGMWTVFVN